MQRYCPAILLLLTFLSSSGVLQGENEDFRIQATVHVGSSSSASVNSLTLFNSATIYDFLDHGMDQSDITVFDITRGRFVLLDPQRRVKTTLTKDFLIRFLEQIRSQTSSTALANYVQPKLEHEFNPVTKTVRVSSDYLTYQATGITPKFDSAVQRYRHFADWAARLNSTRIGNLPPYSRFELNRLLAKQNLMPLNIQRTLMLDEVGLKKQIVRSEHTINWQLTNSDRKRISKTGDQMASFREVTADEFWQLKKQSVRNQR